MTQAQGALGQLLLQMESVFGSAPTTSEAKKIYFSDESLSWSQGKESSSILRGGVRHPTAPLNGTIDIGGSINTELQATSALLYAALGSMSVSMSGGTKGSDLAVTSIAIDGTNQQATVTKTSHALVAGDSVEIASLTAPATLTGIFPVIAATADTFIVRIPMGFADGSATIGSGTVKKVTAAGVCTYTMKAGGKLPSYLIEKGFTDIDQYFVYRGMTCGKLSFSIGISGAIKLSTDWMGAAIEDPDTTSVDSSPIDNGKRSFDNFGIATANIKEGGSEIATVLGIDNITLDNQLDGDTFVVGGGGSRTSINPGEYKVTGKLRAKFANVSLYNKAKSGTESSLDITITRGSGNGSDGNESIQIVIPELLFSPKSPMISGPKGVVVDLDFEGYYDNHADATALKIIVINSVAPGALV